MEKAVVRDEEFTKDIWENSKDPEFVELSLKSRVSAEWLSINPIISKYRELPISPTSNYVDQIGIEPDLVNIEGNVVTLRQKAYADIFLLEKKGKDFYNVDRPWMRQYYNTDFSPEIPSDCFNATYLFFVTWVPKFTTEITYTASDGVDSPVHIYPKKDVWVYPLGRGQEFVNPHMVAFSFKRVGKHMDDEEFGVIRRGDPLFDITFSASDIIVEKIRSWYANNKVLSS